MEAPFSLHRPRVVLVLGEVVLVRGIGDLSFLVVFYNNNRVLQRYNASVGTKAGVPSL